MVGNRWVSKMHGFLRQGESVHPLGERGMDGERRPGVMRDERRATNRPIRNTSLNQLHARRFHTDRARAIHHSVALDSLREEGHRRWRLGGEDGFLERHGFGFAWLGFELGVYSSLIVRD